MHETPTASQQNNTWKKQSKHCNKTTFKLTVNKIFTGRHKQLTPSSKSPRLAVPTVRARGTFTFSPEKSKKIAPRKRKTKRNKKKKKNKMIRQRTGTAGPSFHRKRPLDGLYVGTSRSGPS